MSRLAFVSIEVQKQGGLVPEWTEALSSCVGQVPPSLRDQEVTRCVLTGVHEFRGQIEFGALGDKVFAKLAATPNHFSRSLNTATPTLPTPVLLFLQVSGRCRFEQHNNSCKLGPGNWTLIDTRYSFDVWSLGAGVEVLCVSLDRPSEADATGLLERGVAHRWDGKIGISRVLHSTMRETFNQFDHLSASSGGNLQIAISGMAWHALRDQLELPLAAASRDIRCLRLKSYIESRLADPVLSIDMIAQACGMSVRSVHRAFATDPASSVSQYLWTRRLSHCATALRDPRQTHRPITDICFSLGFNSTSHFSRLFKDHFSIAPRTYRQLHGQT